MDKDSPLFGKIDISYDDFSQLSATDKMSHIRKYSRGRLKPGERLWWLEDENSAGLPLEIKLYMHLSADEKRKLRAEGAILCPQIVGGGRQKDKYNDIAFFFLQHRNVFCPQTRDLYSAGSVAGKERGGNYIFRSLKNIEADMIEAALTLEDDLILEYWGIAVKPEDRIKEWLKRADGFAKSEKPSDSLFTG